jgi:hypothetical protein
VRPVATTKSGGRSFPQGSLLGAKYLFSPILAACLESFNKSIRLVSGNYATNEICRELIVEAIETVLVNELWAKKSKGVVAP